VMFRAPVVAAERRAVVAEVRALFDQAAGTPA